MLELAFLSIRSKYWCFLSEHKPVAWVQMFLLNDFGLSDSSTLFLMFWGSRKSPKKSIMPQQSPDFFYEGPDGKCCRICWPHGLYCSHSALLLSLEGGHTQGINTGVGCIPTELYLWRLKFGIYIIFTCHAIVFFSFPPCYLKMHKPFLVHELSDKQVWICRL